MDLRARHWSGTCCTLMVLAALMLLLAWSASAQARTFGLLVQVKGNVNANYGSNDQDSHNGSYYAQWAYSFRQLVSVDSEGDVHSFPPRFSTSSHPHQMLHSYEVSYGFNDGWDVTEQCCFTAPEGHLRRPVSCGDKPFVIVGTNRWQQDPQQTPAFSIAGNDLSVSLAGVLPADASFHCGLHDGRLDPVIGSPFHTPGLFANLPLGRLSRSKKKLARSCIQTAAFGREGPYKDEALGKNFGEVSFTYLSRERLYKAAKRLDAVVGKAPPAFGGNEPEPVDGSSACAPDVSTPHDRG